MASSPDRQAISAAVKRLRNDGVVPDIAGSLKAGTDALVTELRAAIVGQVSAFTESANPDVLPDLQRHLAAQVEEILRLLRGGMPGDFDFVMAFADRAAEQKFPLDAVLQACRCMHKVLANRVRDAALETANDSAQLRRVVAAAADFTLEYMGAVSTLLTARYVQQTRLLAEAEGDRRKALMSTLLDGYDESDRNAARLLRGAGYLEQRQSYCVAVARSVNPAEMENPARAQRMADALVKALSPASLRVIIGLRDNQVVAIVSGTRRQSGWTRQQASLAERVFEPLRTIGTAALIGLSNDAPSTSHIPRALGEARFALDFANVADRVVPFAGISFRQVLVTQARDALYSALPGWLDDFQAADERAGGALAATLRAYGDADMNVLKAAKALGLHPNTIYARMQRIEKATGLAPTSYHGLTEMLLAIECGATP